MTEGETALVRVPDSDSTQASLFTEHFSGVICFTGDLLFVCVCQKKKRTFQCDPSGNGLPKHMCLCVSCPNHLMRLEAIFLSAPKMSDAFLHASDILKCQEKCLSHGSIII